jgi:hypothetical protein
MVLLEEWEHGGQSTPPGTSPHETKCEGTAKVKARNRNSCSTTQDFSKSIPSSTLHTTMDPGDQSQLQLQPPLGYPYHEYAPSAIRPCATHVDDSGNTVAGLFHLLSCGHIVGVEDYDQRCGRNCQHAVTLVATPSLPGPNGSEASVTPVNS